MTEPGPITLAYLDAHPHEAARVMETLDPAELAAFIAGVPVRLAAPSLASLAAWRTARCLAALPAERAGALVEALPADRRTPCLRAMNHSAREAILERMAGRLARTLRHQIEYPSALVGAVMVADMVTAPVDATIGEVGEAVRAAGGSDAYRVYLVDADGKLAGIVPVAALLKADPAVRASELADRDFSTISAETPLSQVSTDRGWYGHPERPVVDARQRLVGTATLERVLASRGHGNATVSSGSGPAMVLTRAFLVTVTGLARAAGAMLMTPGNVDHDR